MKGCPDCEKRIQVAQEYYARNRKKCMERALDYYYKHVKSRRKKEAELKPVEAAPKYKGKPAGRITIPQQRWGSTRLG